MWGGAFEACRPLYAKASGMSRPPPTLRSSGPTTQTYYLPSTGERITAEQERRRVIGAVVIAVIVTVVLGVVLFLIYYFLLRPSPVVASQLGGSCSSTVPCSTGLVCNGGVCLATAGGACSSTTQCASPSQCGSSGTCVNSLNQPCQNSTNCNTNLSCTGSVCKSTPGAACTSVETVRAPTSARIATVAPMLAPAAATTHSAALDCPASLVHASSTPVRRVALLHPSEQWVDMRPVDHTRCVQGTTRWHMCYHIRLCRR